MASAAEPHNKSLAAAEPHTTDDAERLSVYKISAEVSEDGMIGIENPKHSSAAVAPAHHSLAAPSTLSAKVAADGTVRRSNVSPRAESESSKEHDNADGMILMETIHHSPPAT